MPVLDLFPARRMACATGLPAPTAVRPAEADPLPALTGLRFVAAMMIVVHHYKRYFPWDVSERAPSTLSQGVSLFFVLSGFILTHVYSSRPFPGYAAFVRARLARSWPMHALATLALVLYVRPESITFDGPGWFDKWVQLVFNLTLTHAAMPFDSYIYSWNAVSWSISTEMFFYLAFPFLLVDLRRRWLRHVGLALICAALVLGALRLAGVPTEGGRNEVTLLSGVYANPLVRVVEFVLGMVTWLAWDRWLRDARQGPLAGTLAELVLALAVVAWLGWGVEAVGRTISWPPLAVAFGHAGSAWLFALLIATLARPRGAIGCVLAVRPLVFLGEISFAIYLLHQVLLKFLAGWLPRDAVTPVMVFAALVILAAGAHVAVEKPARRVLGPGKPALG